MIAEVSARIEAKFLSTPSARRATLTSFFSFFDLLLISIHALREEGDGILGVLNPHKYISIHALREEGDAARCCCAAAQQHFYPRPPRGGRLMVTLLLAVVNEISIHALREEGDVKKISGSMLSTIISIHALREEGDNSPAKAGLPPFLFLSTPSARRATLPHSRGFFVSIYFYPRPPRGGRHRLDLLICQGVQHFYPRPPRGGRPLKSGLFFYGIYFYPRPPRGGRR